ncbi:hypothetical protein EV189_1463 [Motilibacter rhizosphaerae]|uniref:Peptidase inhibitor family I36 n=1 Tax=Motilibacter rhizosphaerae TaxID=598652 RepID=A0A4Q7NTH5_9ACTN|nr:hypothetical protein [Motilibacter rhizosphaerae]RZS89692.1 hypothetical protein EV189_1463 [Motilibacter rhizosphaerae]
MPGRRWSLAALLLVAACSSGGGAGAGPSPAALAQEAGCATSTPAEGDLELYVRAEADCAAGGEELAFRTFANNGNRDDWLNAARSFGGVFVVGDRWAVNVDSRSLADRIAAATGGTVS